MLNGQILEAEKRKEFSVQKYQKPELIAFGSVKNLTGGSCGVDIDFYIGGASTPVGNDFGIGC